MDAFAYFYAQNFRNSFSTTNSFSSPQKRVVKKKIRQTGTSPEAPRVVGKLSLCDHPVVGHHNFGINTGDSHRQHNKPSKRQRETREFAAARGCGHHLAPQQLVVLAQGGALGECTAIWAWPQEHASHLPKIRVGLPGKI